MGRCRPRNRRLRPRGSLAILVVLALASVRAGEAGDSRRGAALPGDLEPGAWIEWSETLRLPVPAARETKAVVLTARGVTARFAGPWSVPPRRLDSVLAWSLDDGSGAPDRSAEGVQLLGLSTFNPESLRIGQTQPDSTDAAEWLEARGAVVVGPEEGPLLPRLARLLRGRGRGRGAAHVGTPCTSLLVSFSDAAVVYQVVRSGADGWYARIWIDAPRHVPALPGLWDRSLGAHATHGPCRMAGTLTCRRLDAGRTETLLRLEAHIADGEPVEAGAGEAAPDARRPGVRWTEEHRAVRHGPGWRWTLPVADPISGCEVSRVVRVGWNAHLSSVSHAFRVAGHRCWTVPTFGMVRACQIYVYPSPIEELHLDCLVGEDLRGHVLSLRASAVDAPVRERVTSVAGGQPQVGAFVLEPGALGAHRRRVADEREEREIAGMGRVGSLGPPDGAVRNGQPLFSLGGVLLGVVSQWGSSYEAFVVPLDLASVRAGTIEVPSSDWGERLEARVEVPDGWRRGRLDDLWVRIQALPTHSALGELEALVAEMPGVSRAWGILAYARAMRGDYVKAVEADGYVRDRWPADRLLAVFEAWRELRDEVVASKGNDHCELHARHALAWASSDPALQDAALAALCSCEAYETAADLALQLGLSRPASVADLRKVHAYLQREGDTARAAQVEALLRAASERR